MSARSESAVLEGNLRRGAHPINCGLRGVNSILCGNDLRRGRVTQCRVDVVETVLRRLKCRLRCVHRFVARCHGGGVWTFPERLEPVSSSLERLFGSFEIETRNLHVCCSRRLLNLGESTARVVQRIRRIRNGGVSCGAIVGRWHGLRRDESPLGSVHIALGDAEGRDPIGIAPVVPVREFDELA